MPRHQRHNSPPVRTDEEKIRELAQIGGRALKDPRSPERAYQSIEYAKMKLRHLQIDCERFVAMVEEMEANRSWEAVPTTGSYGSQDAMFQAELGVVHQDLMDAITRLQTVIGGSGKC